MALLRCDSNNRRGRRRCSCRVRTNLLVFIVRFRVFLSFFRFTLGFDLVVDTFNWEREKWSGKYLNTRVLYVLTVLSTFVVCIESMRTPDHTIRTPNGVWRWRRCWRRESISHSLFATAKLKSKRNDWRSIEKPWINNNNNRRWTLNNRPFHL